MLSKYITILMLIGLRIATGISKGFVTILVTGFKLKYRQKKLELVWETLFEWHLF